MLLASDGTFYGTTTGGGTFNVGTVFKLAPDGSLTTLASFGGSNGSYPYSTLTPGLDGNFYGTTLQGGTDWCGTVHGITVWTYCGTAGTAFRVTPEGTLTTLVSFDGNSHGAAPVSGLVRASDGNFYGVAGLGGASGYGVVYRLTPDGTLTTLVAFDNGAAGGTATGALLVGSDGNLYGRTTSGGAYGLGTVFRLSGFLLSPNHPPVAQCQNVTVAAGLDCSADASINAGSYDPDPGDTITMSQSPAGPYPLGTTTVTLTVTDNHGASSSCTAAVTVADTTPPNITCPANISIGCSADLLTPVVFSVTATDNCDPAPVVISSPASGAGFPVGTTTVNSTAWDASGNQSSCSFTVTRTPLGFSGFLSPIGGADATGGSFTSPLRTFKLGSTIPVKFTASCGGSPVLTGIQRLQVIQYTTQTTAGAAIDATPTDAATTGDEFLLSNGQWIFNLDTKATGMTIGIWQLVAILSDASQHTAWVQLK